MNIKKVICLGMELEEWTHESCTAHFGVGDDWATLYDIESADKGKGHATELLSEAKKHYEKQGKGFAGTVALTPEMAHLYKKLKITEYK